MHRPGFTALAVLTLGIGIGVNAIAFSGLNALLFKPFKFAGSERLGWIQMSSPGNPYGATSIADYEELRRTTGAFETIVAERRLPVSVRLNGRAEQGWALLVSANYLSVLGARPAIGRVFTEADLQSPDLPAVVSHRFWTTALGGGDSLAAREVVVNGRSFSIAGVLRDDFQGPGGLYEPDIWLPLERLDVLARSSAASDRDRPWLALVGRTKAGVTAVQAEAELQAIVRHLADRTGDARERSARFYPMPQGHPEVRDMAPYLWIAMGVVGVVLLIACFNVAGLLLARAAERRREMCVRAALGASRARILRQLITEGMVLAVLGGGAALVLAAWSADLLAAFSLPAPIPQRLHIGIDRRLVLFIGGMVMVAGVVPALIPALQTARRDLSRTMKVEDAGGGRPSRARSVFVIAQVAGSTLFLASALLFVRSFLVSAAFDPGFDTAHTLVAVLDPSAHGYDAARSRRFFEDLTARIAALPGVRHAAVADRVPLSIGFPNTIEVSGDATDCATADCRQATVYKVGPGHFASLGMPLVAGRDFSAADPQADAQVVIGAYLASQLWTGGDAVGRSVRLGDRGRSAVVIGVAGDLKYRSKSQPLRAHLYQLISDADFGGPATVAIQAAGDPLALVGGVREQVRAIDPALPIQSLKTMTQLMEVPLWPARTAAGFFLVCGTLALVLATVGLFGVTYYAVAQRTREFGIRAALGATPRMTMALVLREGIFLAAPGVVLGIGAALVAGRVLARFLFGVNPADPLAFALTAAVQATLALAACASPAWRATRADPIAALRED
jgi:predicted permease